MIYHITTPFSFAKFDDKDQFEAESLHTEGFIHCSTFKQLKGTSERYYSDETEIIVLIIDEQKLSSELKYEMAKIGEEFPHIYGPINKSAIIEKTIIKAANGQFNFEPEAFIS